LLSFLFNSPQGRGNYNRSKKKAPKGIASIPSFLEFKVDHGRRRYCLVNKAAPEKEATGKKGPWGAEKASSLQATPGKEATVKKGPRGAEKAAPLQDSPIFKLPTQESSSPESSSEEFEFQFCSSWSPIRILKST
jgi:hypothetical protein